MLMNMIAFCLIVGCYAKMYWAIRGSSAWNTHDSRIAKRMAILVFTDFFCWAPISFFSLTAVFGHHMVSLEGAKLSTIFVLPINSCANPFLYAIITKKTVLHFVNELRNQRFGRKLINLISVIQSHGVRQEDHLP